MSCRCCLPRRIAVLGLFAGTQMRLRKRDWQQLFPDTCPWTESQVLDEDFLPELAREANGRA